MTKEVPIWEQLNPSEKIRISDNEVDNRDIWETWLRVEGYTVFVIDPMMLFANAVNNCGHDNLLPYLVDVLDDLATGLDSDGEAIVKDIANSLRNHLEVK